MKNIYLFIIVFFLDNFMISAQTDTLKINLQLNEYKVINGFLKCNLKNIVYYQSKKIAANNINEIYIKKQTKDKVFIKITKIDINNIIYYYTSFDGLYGFFYIDNNLFLLKGDKLKDVFHRKKQKKIILNYFESDDLFIQDFLPEWEFIFYENYFMYLEEGPIK